VEATGGRGDVADAGVLDAVLDPDLLAHSWGEEEWEW
jgi:hypothetical protein